MAGVPAFSGTSLPALYSALCTLNFKNATAKGALTRLEAYIRSTAETSGRLHISDISVDEEESGDGFYKGCIVYGNPDTFGSKDKINGIVPAYGDRYSATRERR